ncbi:MAG: mycofactocin biosynthesis peptidyl-dipeptidase MftE [Actinobacteria bacterium]|nr:mycofactocin biosynthesis peptidyl-dipeptidase MftE [Actinomycetota bacterium]
MTRSVPASERLLARATTREVAHGGRVFIPIGSTEQHGPHLPLDTDTRIAAAVADRVAGLADQEGSWVGPAIPYGASGEHQSFSGTASIGTAALQLTILELVRSVQSWAGQVVLVNGHGGNVEAVVAAVGQLRREGHDVAWVPCKAPGADAHAGHTETSILLHLAPELVRIDRLEAGNTKRLQDIYPALVAGGVSAVSSNGVLGDPRGANREAGAALFEAIILDVESRIATGCVDSRGTMVR